MGGQVLRRPRLWGCGAAVRARPEASVAAACHARGSFSSPQTRSFPPLSHPLSSTSQASDANKPNELPFSELAKKIFEVAVIVRFSWDERREREAG